MKKVLYYTLRVISVILAIPALIVGIPGFALMVLSDYLDPDPYNLNRK
jgi:hypothetical protein